MKRNQQVPPRRSAAILGMKAVSSGVNMECEICSFNNHLLLLWGWTKAWPSIFGAEEPARPKGWKEWLVTDAGTILLTPLASETLLNLVWRPRGDVLGNSWPCWKAGIGTPGSWAWLSAPDLDSWPRGSGGKHLQGHSLSLGHRHLLQMTSATSILMLFSLNPWLSEPQSKKQN